MLELGTSQQSEDNFVNSLIEISKESERAREISLNLKKQTYAKQRNSAFCFQNNQLYTFNEQEEDDVAETETAQDQ